MTGGPTSSASATPASGSPGRRPTALSRPRVLVVDNFGYTRRRLAGGPAPAVPGRHHRRWSRRHRRLRQRRRLGLAGPGRRLVHGPASWWSTTSATTPAAGGSIGIRGSWPTPPAMAAPTSSASAMLASGSRARSRRRVVRGAGACGRQLRLRRRRLAGRPAPEVPGRHDRRWPRRHRRLRQCWRLGIAIVTG